MVHLLEALQHYLQDLTHFTSRIASEYPLFVTLSAALSLVITFLAGCLTLRYVHFQQKLNLPILLRTPTKLNNKVQYDRSSSSISRIIPRISEMGVLEVGVYGTLYGLWTRVVHVVHPEVARILLGASSTDQLDEENVTMGILKTPAYNHFLNFSGSGVFTADGEDWKRKRLSVIHALFKAQNLNSNKISSFDRMEQEANRAADFFIEQLSLNKKDDEPYFDMDVVPLLQQATFGVIYRYLTHDADCDSILYEEVQLEKHKKKKKTKISSSRLEKYLEAIVQIRVIILTQSRSLWFLLPRWIYEFFSPLYKEEERAMEPIRNLARTACKRAQPGSPLDVLRNRPSHANDTLSHYDSNITKSLLDEAVTLLFAGQDTSAATLSWTLHLLSINPRIQEKLREEIVNNICICRDENDGGEEKKSEQSLLSSSSSSSTYISRRDIMKLPYLDAVIKESMRLYPVAPFVVRNVPTDVEIPTKTNCIIPKGTFACIWLYSLHRNPQFWTDPNKFIPERWLDADQREKDIGRSNGAYMPFAAGPRGCLGQSMGNVILRIMLSRILVSTLVSDSDYEKGVDAGQIQKEMQSGFTVLPTGGLQLRLREVLKQNKSK